MVTKMKASYYRSPRDDMVHVDLYVILEDISHWAGHICMTPAQWSALGGLLMIGDKNSTACELLVEKAFEWED